MKTFFCFLAAGALAGLAACFVTIGPSNGVHAQGFPVPLVFWDRNPATGDLVPHEGFAGLLLNPLCFALLSLALWALLRLVRRFILSRGR